LGYEGRGLGFRVQGAGLMVEWFGVQGLGFRIMVKGLRV
jgi:hypothetical protein